MGFSYNDLMEIHEEVAGSHIPLKRWSKLGFGHCARLFLNLYAHSPASASADFSVAGEARLDGSASDELELLRYVNTMPHLPRSESSPRTRMPRKQEA